MKKKNLNSDSKNQKDLAEEALRQKAAETSPQRAKGTQTAAETSPQTAAGSPPQKAAETSPQKSEDSLHRRAEDSLRRRAEDSLPRKDKNSLRRRAEDSLRRKAEDLLKMQPEVMRKLSTGDMEKNIEELIHELGVHQVELEMQNDELRQKQVELTSSRDRYLDLYDFAPVGYFTIDSQGLIVEANLPAARLLGMERGKLIGHRFHHFVASSHQDIFYLHTRDVMETQVNQSCELTMKKGNGMEFYAELKSIGVADEKGNFTLFRTAVSDVTERKLMQDDLKWQHDRLEATVNQLKTAMDALRESEARYSTLVEQANDGVAVIQDEVCQFANEAMARMLGYTVEEIIGRHFLEFVAHEARDFIIERHRARMAGEPVPCFYETRFQHKGGAIREVEVSASVITYQGKPAAMTTIRDITERKKTEEELRKVQRLESIGVLAGGIAHDFRNILTGIIGGLSLIRLYVRGEDRLMEILDTVETASLRAKELSEQLLTFARGGAPVKKLASFQELLKGTADFVLKGSKTRCALTLPDDLWPVEIDPGQISQVLNNLILNADQAMPDGGTLRIEAENVTIGQEEGLPLEGGNYIRVSVKDEGVGIPKELLGKIFDPYFTTRQQGSGLGLATAYSIIKRHEGHLTVNSDVGVGTTFSFYLPAAALIGIEKFKRQAQPQAQPEAENQRKRILVMEDEGIVRGIIRELLNHLGYSCALAWNGDEAIRLYTQALESGQPFQAVLLDLIIQGGMGGAETLLELQKIDPEVKAIVTSGYSNDPILADYESYGFKAALAKPFDIKQLLKALQSVM
jgi:two-component system cell cycle sensor histidine kinase/response regulator CckA